MESDDRGPEARFLRGAGMRTLLGKLAETLAAALLAAVGYLLVLLGGAALARRRGGAQPLATTGDPGARFAVLVPAHDEEASIASTLESLFAQDYPSELYDVVVIADNCSDATAAVAREHGALVLERSDATQRGKGFALAWALERLPGEADRAEAIAFVDADCRVTPNFLTALGARLRAGAQAVQSANVVANPEESTASALRYAAFALVNWVKPLGRTTLGLSTSLHGTGMAMTRDVLRRHPWNAFGLAEDHEYAYRLIAAGERIDFAPEAAVTSDM